MNIHVKIGGELLDRLHEAQRELFIISGEDEDVTLTDTIEWLLNKNEILQYHIERQDDEIEVLEEDLENAYKGQEDFKRTIKELERKVEHLDDINKELLEENKALDESNDHLIYKNEELNHSNEYLVDRIEELKTEIQKLNRTIYLKDQIITTYKIEGAKLFHENEKLRKRIEYLEKTL